MGADASTTERAILVVEDDHAQAHATVRLLKIAGFDAFAASNIESAMAELSRRSFHAVLVDMHLGPERGCDLISMVRREHPAATTVLVSGSEPDEVEGVAKACGATAYLTKPFELDNLLELLES